MSTPSSIVKLWLNTIIYEDFLRKSGGQKVIVVELKEFFQVESLTSSSCIAKQAAWQTASCLTYMRVISKDEIQSITCSLWSPMRESWLARLPHKRGIYIRHEFVLEIKTRIEQHKNDSNFVKIDLRY